MSPSAIPSEGLQAAVIRLDAACAKAAESKHALDARRRFVREANERAVRLYADAQAALRRATTLRAS